MDKGTKGTITFGDGSTAKVIIVDKKEFPATGMPTEYFLTYQPGETNKQIIHPTTGETFPLPEGMMNVVFKADGAASEKENVENSSEVHPDFSHCSKIYKTEHKKHGLPLHLGIDTSQQLFYLGFGSAKPYVMNKDELVYLVNALGIMTSQTLRQEMGKTPEEIKKAIAATTQDIKCKAGGVPQAGQADELKKQIFGEEGGETESGSLDAFEAGLEEIKAISEQVEEFTKDMSAEEKAEYIKEMNQKQEDLLAKKTREFERSLLGSIEEEESVTYNYDYFKNINEKQGKEALREELAKLPKEERQEIINKIIAEAKIKQQKPLNNNEKAD